MKRWRSRIPVIALIPLLMGSSCAGIDASDLDFDDETAVEFLFAMPPAICQLFLYLHFGSEFLTLSQRYCDVSASAAYPRGLDLAAGGTFVAQTFDVVGTVSARKFGVWTAVLPAALESSRGGPSGIVANVSADDGDDGVPKKLPAKLQATLYTVDAAGKRKKIGRRTARLDKTSGVATVEFNSVASAADHYEVDLKLKGGKASDGTLALGAAATFDSVGARAPWRRGAAARGSLWSPDRRVAATITADDTVALASIEVLGTESSNSLPERSVSLYRPSAARLGGRAAEEVDVLGIVMVVNDDVVPPVKLMNRVDFTLYDVDAAGERTELSSSSAKVDPESGVGFAFLGTFGPATDHYEVVAAAAGGSVANAGVVVGASLTAAPSVRWPRPWRAGARRRAPAPRTAACRLAAAAAVAAGSAVATARRRRYCTTNCRT